MTNAQLIANLQDLLKQAMQKQQTINVQTSAHGSYANDIKKLKALKLPKNVQELIKSQLLETKQKAVSKTLKAKNLKTSKITPEQKLKVYSDKIKELEAKFETLQSKKTKKQTLNFGVNLEQESSNHLFLQVDDFDVSEFTQEQKKTYFAFCASIRQLMKSRNTLFDSSENQSQVNQAAISKALAMLDAAIDGKIDSLNKYYEAIQKQTLKLKAPRGVMR